MRTWYQSRGCQNLPATFLSGKINIRALRRTSMVDNLSSVRRSANMAAIRGRDTQPERAVRRILSEFGVRYRLHVPSLPGRPDVVMRKRRKIVEVRGCFWHRHAGCKYAYTPKSRTEFWRQKFERNVERDAVNEEKLRALGYEVLVVWECSTREPKKLRARLRAFLRVARPGLSS